MLGTFFASTDNGVVSNMLDNATFYVRSSTAGLILLMLVAGFMLRNNMNKFVIGYCAVGAFWGGWIVHGFIFHQDNPLFEGDDDAKHLVQLFIRDWVFALAFVLSGGIVWLICSEKKISYPKTGGYLLCALLTTSMVGTMWGAAQA